MNTSIAIQRNHTVKEVVDAIREIERRDGITRESLRKIYLLLLELVERRELFSESDFPATTDSNGLYPMYRLSEDEDNRFAMYINSSVGENHVAPHDHTTWAVTVSICGTEENRFYERTDDRSVQNKSTLRLFDTETVRPGVGVCMMPDDIHSIHAINETPALILHMYGKALDHLSNRTNYDLENGTHRLSAPTVFIIESRFPTTLS